MSWTRKDAHLEVVTWLDHAGPTNYLEDTGLVKRWTAGWIIEETPDHIVIAGTVDSIRPEDLNTLGKAMIVKRRTIA